jgi:hypothetical protein
MLYGCRMARENQPGSNTTAGAGANARDLGYLEKFLAKLRNDAATMPPGETRTRLETLLREETDRWSEITVLVGAHAEPTATAPSPSAPTAAWQRPNPRVQRDARIATPGSTPDWKPRVTIGSLKQPAK